jgi:hypothetical protein
VLTEDEMKLMSQVSSVPTSYEEAVNSRESDEWLHAINDELQAHKKNNT